MMEDFTLAHHPALELKMPMIEDLTLVPRPVLEHKYKTLMTEDLTLAPRPVPDSDVLGRAQSPKPGPAQPV